MRNFKGKVVLITGASSGIGAASAREFARRGATVALLARRLPRLQAVAREIRRSGGQVVVLRCDVTRNGELEQAVNQIRDKVGTIDVVLANAGFEVTGPFEKLTIRDYRRQFETNVFGVLRTAFATLDDLKANRGCLVLVGSLLGHFVLPNTTAYSMSKFAVTALAEGLRRELHPAGVSVILITPGNIETEIRKIDNKDVLHKDLRDPVPAWLRMPADRAAKKIVAAVSRRRTEAIITKVGKLAIFTERHAPGLVSLAINLGHLKGRPEPGGSRQAGSVRHRSKAGRA